MNDVETGVMDCRYFQIFKRSIYKFFVEMKIDFYKYQQIKTKESSVYLRYPQNIATYSENQFRYLQKKIRNGTKFNIGGDFRRC